MKVSDLMNDYFSGKKRQNLNLLSESCPVVPHRETWEVVQSPERLRKKYVFSERPRLIDFLNGVFSIEKSLTHHGVIRVDHLEVDIEVYTRDVNRITNIDREYAKSVDLLHEDVKLYSYRVSSFE